MWNWYLARVGTGALLVWGRAPSPVQAERSSASRAEAAHYTISVPQRSCRCTIPNNL